MKKLDSFEWLLICLFVITLAVGVLVADSRNSERVGYSSVAPDRGANLRY